MRIKSIRNKPDRELIRDSPHLAIKGDKWNIFLWAFFFRNYRAIKKFDCTHNVQWTDRNIPPSGSCRVRPHLNVYSISLCADDIAVHPPGRTDNQPVLKDKFSPYLTILNHEIFLLWYHVTEKLISLKSTRQYNKKIFCWMDILASVIAI